MIYSHYVIYKKDICLFKLATSFSLFIIMYLCHISFDNLEPISYFLLWLPCNAMLCLYHRFSMFCRSILMEKAQWVLTMNEKWTRSRSRAVSSVTTRKKHIYYSLCCFNLLAWNSKNKELVKSRIRFFSLLLARHK
jgi:hypothetical protein